MRVFLAGATGVLGVRLLPLLVAAGHQVAGTTRAVERAAGIAAAGGVPVVVDVYDRAALTDAVVGFRPDLVMHQLTDLPDDPAQIPARADGNARIRTEGTANLIAAATAAAAPRFLAQSIAWTPPGRGDAVAVHERAVLGIGGVVVRYGQLYGPGTYYESEPPTHPRIHVDDAAARTIPLLEADSGVVVLAESDRDAN
ncbi:NAD-dependent epimerase/dehydratase family protein [Nocardia farcinica]|uniref:NAD-dependent epimerase/dehydratase family protein n=1 Tax=Nocardia farcinica TaxID=37329 RepID=UPI0015F11447|nr:NAD-dependent epimerase/dehydratase family protein [Nocardia farcinica]MBA4855249.1 NAD(P)-dependent oxidoreductase [Nocardia farcinica]MBC9817756.1 NAD(P)-dependent oxidoreductase [Nocardia farcinica]